MKMYQDCKGMSALAYLYDNLRDFPIWFQKLTPGQLEDVSEIMVLRELELERRELMPRELVPIEEVEKCEILRAVQICDGNILKAAKALHLGKTTVYRKLRSWGYTIYDRLALRQASALAEKIGQTRVENRFQDPH